MFVSINSGYLFGQSKTIGDEWNTVQPPKPPELKRVTIDPKTTALLVLDIVKQTCNNERRPRCVASVPKIQAYIEQYSAVHLLSSPATTQRVTLTRIDLIQF
ncbi:MAG: hypothetical protein HY695_34525 [Deltaproteobacteria bacterium]|nr:hypothetical protein [Deltaproteobacteria bacterium]